MVKIMKGKKNLSNEISNSTKDNLRITISIGLLASYLTIIYMFNNFVVNISPEIDILIRGFVNIYFLIGAIFLLIFLVLKAATMKYKSPNNIGIVDIYIPPNFHKFFFDVSISLILYSPGAIFLVVFFKFFPEFIQKWFTEKAHAFIVSFLIFAGILLVFWFLVDYFINYKMRGHQ